MPRRVRGEENQLVAERARLVVARTALADKEAECAEAEAGRVEAVDRALGLAGEVDQLKAANAELVTKLAAAEKALADAVKKAQAR